MLDQELIDTYLTKKSNLSTKDCIMIETLLNENEKFSKDLALQKEIIEAIEMAFNQELKNKLKAFT